MRLVLQIVWQMVENSVKKVLIIFGDYNYFYYEKNRVKYLGIKFDTMDEAVLALSGMKKFDLTLYKLDMIEMS